MAKRAALKVGVVPESLFEPWQPQLAEPALPRSPGVARLDRGFPPPNGHARAEKPPVFAGYWSFLLAGLQHSEQTGAIVPSQRFLVDRMICPVPTGYRGHVLELGAGTGSLTRRLAVTRPHARITAVEINPKLAELLKRALRAEKLEDRIEVVAEAAEDLLVGLRRAPRKPEFIISGIPLGTLHKTQVMSLINGIYAALPPGGMYIQFQYSLLDRKKIQSRFTRVRTVPVILNFPPAFVYYARK